MTESATKARDARAWRVAALRAAELASELLKVPAAPGVTTFAEADARRAITVQDLRHAATRAQADSYLDTDGGSVARPALSALNAAARAGDAGFVAEALRRLLQAEPEATPRILSEWRWAASLAANLARSPARPGASVLLALARFSLALTAGESRERVEGARVDLAEALVHALRDAATLAERALALLEELSPARAARAFEPRAARVALRVWRALREELPREGGEELERDVLALLAERELTRDAASG